MSEQTDAFRKQSILIPMVFGLTIVIVGLLYQVAHEHWFSMKSPAEIIYQDLVSGLFFFTVLIAPILLAWKTDWPVWFCGLACGFIGTALVQNGIHGAPEDAEAIGSLLCITFGFQSIISAGIALATRSILKRFGKMAARQLAADETAASESSHLP